MTDPPPNVLFITADQLRGDCLGAAGHPLVRTPWLDQLAAEGVLFRRHYAQSAPCGPSRASLYTGMYLCHHRSCINGTPLDARFTNLALEARKAGYRPVLFGYTDTALDPRTLPAGAPELTTYGGVLPGFDALLHLPSHHRHWLAWLAERGYDVTDDPKDIWRPVENYPGAGGRGPTFPPPRYPAAECETAYLTDAVIDYVRAEAATPWFVHLSYHRPHPPFVAPEPYNAMYHPADVPWPPPRAATPEREAALHPWLAWKLATLPDRYLGSDRNLAQIRATYYGMISQVDDQLGRLFDVLRATGQWARTLVVFCSDHGELLGEHYLLGKHGFFDAAFHVPMILRDPRPAADPGRGRAVDRFTENIDVMATILDALGREVPLQSDGRSLLPFARGEAPERWRDAAHWEYDFRDPEWRRAEIEFGLRQDQCSLAVIRDAHYKYVHFTALPALFFDLEDDPDELVDRAGDPDYLPLVLHYAQQMLSWRMNQEERTLTGTKLTASGPITVREPRR